jgi:hypothetical protein
VQRASISETSMRKVLFICLSLVACGIANAQQKSQTPTRQVKLILIGFKHRKPLANQHLVVFEGTTDKEARAHSIRFNLATDASGVTTLPTPPHMVWFQVWHEVGKFCPETPPKMVSHSNVLFDEGVIVSDSCESGWERLQPYNPNPLPIVRIPPDPQSRQPGGSHL